MMDSTEEHYCVFVALSIWLEYYFSYTNNRSPYLLDFSGDCTVNGGQKTRNKMLRVLNDIIGSDSFEKSDDGPLSSHSIRKYALHVLQSSLVLILMNITTVVDGERGVQ